MSGLSQLQQIFLLIVVGLFGYWIIAIAYEVYLRFTEKCVNCIVEDPGRLRFFKRVSLIIAVLMVGGTILSLVYDSYLVFVTFVLALYFFRVFMLARSRYTSLVNDEDGEYDPNMTFGEDLRETMGQFKLLLTKPRQFFNQHK
ncbi:MAG: hypothetical protein FH749_03425 [Firmicutes bacterium]|nr:hypothetical protein [Bacillota bacterium]